MNEIKVIDGKKFKLYKKWIENKQEAKNLANSVRRLSNQRVRIIKLKSTKTAKTMYNIYIK